MVESHLRFANESWGSLPKTKLDADNWSCDWLSIENIIRFDRPVMAYKILNKLSPENLWGKFQQRSSQSNFATRHCKDLQIPRLNTEHAKKRYQYSTVKIWNTIPPDSRELPTICHFKKKLKVVSHLRAN